MNPVIKILTSVIITINRLIDSLSLRTIESIRRGFFFIIFILCLSALYIGFRMGTKSARIKSAPLAEYVNDTFKIDVNRERKAGDFSEMLESEIVKDSPINNFSKSTFSVRENLNPELSKNTFEPENKIAEPDTLEKPFKPETPIENNVNDKAFTEKSNVKPADKIFQDKKVDEIILKNDRKDENSDVKDDNVIKIIDKDKEVLPKPIKKDSGIIGK